MSLNGKCFAMITHRTYEQLTSVCDNVSARGSEILSRSVCQLFIAFCNIVNCLWKGLTMLQPANPVLIQDKCTCNNGRRIFLLWVVYIRRIILKSNLCEYFKRNIKRVIPTDFLPWPVGSAHYEQFRFY